MIASGSLGILMVKALALDRLIIEMPSKTLINNNEQPNGCIPLVLEIDKFCKLSTSGIFCHRGNVMKMGNIAPRVGIEPTSLAIRASVLSLKH